MKLTIQIGRKPLAFFLLLKQTFATMPHSGILSYSTVVSIECPRATLSFLDVVCSPLSPPKMLWQSVLGLMISSLLTTGMSTRTTKRISGTLPGSTQVAGLEQSDVRIMIFTHWNPSRDARAVDPRHATSSITSAVSTDLSMEKCFQSEKVKLWAFGHTHYNCDFTIERKEGAGSIRLLTNQRGYYFA